MISCILWFMQIMRLDGPDYVYNNSPTAQTPHQEEGEDGANQREAQGGWEEATASSRVQVGGR